MSLKFFGGGGFGLEILGDDFCCYSFDLDLIFTLASS